MLELEKHSTEQKENAQSIIAFIWNPKESKARIYWQDTDQWLPESLLVERQSLHSDMRGCLVFCLFVLFFSTRNVLYLDGDDGYRDEHICQISSNSVT